MCVDASEEVAEHILSCFHGHAVQTVRCAPAKDPGDGYNLTFTFEDGEMLEFGFLSRPVAPKLLEPFRQKPRVLLHTSLRHRAGKCIVTMVFQGGGSVAVALSRVGDLRASFSQERESAVQDQCRRIRVRHGLAKKVA